MEEREAYLEMEVEEATEVEVELEEAPVWD